MVFKHNGQPLTDIAIKENPNKRYYRLIARCSICWSKYRFSALNADFTDKYICPNCQKHKRKTYNFQLVKIRCSDEEFRNILSNKEVQIIKSEIIKN